MGRWIQKFHKRDLLALKTWLRTSGTRLRYDFPHINPAWIYLLFWVSMLVDMGSTLFMITWGSHYQWVEANPIFYELGMSHFFGVSLLINTALFLLAMYHQTRWNRGAAVLFISIFVHGAYGLNNLTQLVTLHMRFWL